MNSILTQTARGACVIVFTAFCLTMIWSKLQFYPLILNNYDTLSSQLFVHLDGGRFASRPNLRIIGTIIALGLLELNEFIFNFHFWGIERSQFFAGADALRGISDFQVNVAKFDPKTPPLFATYLAYPIVVLSPILILAMNWEQNPFRALILIIAVMSAVCGWNATLIAFLFSIPGTFVEWPQAYFLFEQSLASYDLSAIGMTILIFIYLRFRILKKTWELVVLAILAQLTFEYMGLVFFSAVFVQTYYQAGPGSLISRLLEAAKKSAVIGLAAICTAFLSYIIFFSIGNELSQPVPSLSAVAANLESFAHAKWWIIIMISMLVPSVFVGACIGLAFALTSGKLMARDIGADLTISGGILIGFSLVLAIGVFTAYYPSELGRQMLPISITTLLFSIRTAEYFAAAWLRN